MKYCLYLHLLSILPAITLIFMLRYRWDIPLTYKTPVKSGTLMFNRTQGIFFICFVAQIFLLFQYSHHKALLLFLYLSETGVISRSFVNGIRNCEHSLLTQCHILLFLYDFSLFEQPLFFLFLFGLIRFDRLEFRFVLNPKRFDL